MPVARNMKELEKMVLDRMKKELPNATKEYCHKWYNNNSDIKKLYQKQNLYRWRMMQCRFLWRMAN